MSRALQVSLAAPRRSSNRRLWIFVAFVVALYAMPYLRVRFGVSQYVAVREVLGVALVFTSIPAIARYGYKLPRWFFIMLAAYFLGFAQSDSPAIAFVTLRTLLQFLVVFLIAGAVSTDQRSVIRVCFVFLVMAILAGVCVGIQLLKGPVDILNIYPAFDEASQRFGFNRYGSFFGNSITTAMLLLIGFWQAMLCVTGRVARTVSAGIAAVGVSATISKAPAAIMAVSLPLGLLATRHVQARLSTRRTAIISLGLIAAAAVVYFAATHYDYSMTGNETLRENFSEDIRYRTLDKGELAKEAFSRKGWLAVVIGCGFDSAGQAAAEGNAFGFKPHNFILEVFVTMGLVGLVAYGVAIGDFAKRIMALDGSTTVGKWVKGLGIGVIAALASALFVDPHVTNVIMVPFFYLLGVLYTRPIFFASVRHDRKMKEGQN